MPAVDTLNIFKALSDKTRLDIVRALVRDHNDSKSCSEVSTVSSLSQPAMSHHFGKLVDAGILVERKDGTEKIYHLNSTLLLSAGIDPKKL